MKNSIIAGIAVAALSILLTVIYFSVKVSSQNKEIELKKQTIAQQDVCRANFDKMFKTITNLAEIPERFAEKSKEAFKEIYPALMDGRYKNDNTSLMKWVQESNPQYDMKSIQQLYMKLADAIEANRDEFFMEQKLLIDMKREHDTYTKKWPASSFVGDSADVQITIITSTETENTYKTGKDDNIKLFN